MECLKPKSIKREPISDLSDVAYDWLPSDEMLGLYALFLVVLSSGILFWYSLKTNKMIVNK